MGVWACGRVGVQIWKSAYHLSECLMAKKTPAQNLAKDLLSDRIKISSISSYGERERENVVYKRRGHPYLV